MKRYKTVEGVDEQGNPTTFKIELPDNRAVLISERPKHACNVLNGIKTREIRKTKPTIKLPATVLMYVTQAGDIARITSLPKDRFVLEKNITENDFKSMRSDYSAKGMVVAQFTLKRVEPIKCGWRYEDCLYHYETNEMDEKELLKRSCLSMLELVEYLGRDGKTISNIVGYAWHIDDLIIFDNPRPLSDFGIEKAPQSYGYVEVEK